MIVLNRPVPREKLKLLIFDLDGTLVDSRLDLANSINAMLRNFGRAELPLDTIASYIGDGAPTLVRRALGDPEDQAFLMSALEYFLLYYREHKLDNTLVYDGILPALQQLSALNNGSSRRLAVLSNKPVNPSRQIVKALGLGDFFFQVYGGNSFPTKKPDPTGVNTLRGECGCAPEETIIIGDSDIDVLTARNAGIWSCGVTYGFAPHSLQAAPPDVLIDSPAELIELFHAPSTPALKSKSE
ncbi:MAG TPA: HAD-IA family hydrolase [Terriglobales bacterium]|nr:HAD-IA family hydrolase [Terriglobales bacterium]